MKFSKFSERFSRKSGILDLMDDLGQAHATDQEIYMLGGGNPASIPEMEVRFRQEAAHLLDDTESFDRLLGKYDSPRGNHLFISALAQLLQDQFGWPVNEGNIAITNGSQSSFGILFNILSGQFTDGSRKHILLPMTPEYIGYADTGLDAHGTFRSSIPVIRDIESDGQPMFKYNVDFDALEVDQNCGAICVSRPTNPTGNIITDEELSKLHALAEQNQVPLIIDAAYGLPFPGIVFEKHTPIYDSNTILCLSLSKLGLAGVRTGIVIADTPVIEIVRASNAINNLAPGSFGPALVTRMIKSGELLDLCREIVRPYYLGKRNLALQMIQDEMSHLPVKVHKPEGAMFLWLWFPDFPITSEELYQNLKIQGVYVIAGHHFFPGLDRNWEHKHQCIRVSYAADADTVRYGIKKIAEEATRAYHGL